jgi:proline iminopeptidase
MDRLAGIPAVLIHGRHDISGPLDTAWSLHRQWASSRLVVGEDAGHGGGSFADELIAALRSFAGIARHIAQAAARTSGLKPRALFCQPALPAC